MEKLRFLFRAPVNYQAGIIKPPNGDANQGFLSSRQYRNLSRFRGTSAADGRVPSVYMNESKKEGYPNFEATA